MPTQVDYLLIQQWQNAEKALAYWREEERRLRDAAVAQLFGAKQDGSYTADLGGGYSLKYVQTSKVTVDAAAMQGPAHVIATQYGNPKLLTDMFRWKPSLVMSVYREQPRDIKQLLTPALTTKPDAAKLELVEPKVSR